jgi:hypothetical protein
MRSYVFRGFPKKLLMSSWLTDNMGCGQDRTQSSLCTGATSEEAKEATILLNSLHFGIEETSESKSLKMCLG